jgi:hypothetical protein
MQGEIKKGFYMYNAPNLLNPFQQELMYKSGRDIYTQTKAATKGKKKDTTRKENCNINSLPLQ